MARIDHRGEPLHQWARTGPASPWTLPSAGRRGGEPGVAPVLRVA